jgi:pyruvate-formate lyase-activating enzyme
MDREHIRQDYQSFLDRVLTLIETPDLDPVTYLDIERQEPYSAEISAPYRLDCALTYEVSEESHREHAPQDRVDRELTTEEWVNIFQTAFEKGIPHLLFTGGEPTLRGDLPDLILKAEELGLVTGLLTDGFKLEDDAYRSMLLLNGLDHLMIVFDPQNPREWEILQKVLADDIHTTVHLTLHKGENLHPHLERLGGRWVCMPSR